MELGDGMVVQVKSLPSATLSHLCLCRTSEAEALPIMVHSRARLRLTVSTFCIQCSRKYLLYMDDVAKTTFPIVNH